MRNDNVLYRVLHVEHDAKCFCRVHTRIFIGNYPTTYESNEYKQEVSGTGLNRKQCLVETDS